MLQPFAAHPPIPTPQSLRLAIAQLQHHRCIAQLQVPTTYSPHDFHPLPALPPLVHCRKCGSRLLQMNAVFFSYGRKGVEPPVNCLHKLRTNTTQPRERADVPTPATPSSRFLPSIRPCLPAHGNSFLTAPLQDSTMPNG